ncbi:MAG: sensor histidine kinase [Bacteroidales bacterium]|nr:sensor histidine kinase [Bacteroidales bacterium]
MSLFNVIATSFCILVFNCSLLANSTIEKLKEELNTCQQEERAKVLNELAKSYLRVNVDSSSYFLNIVFKECNIQNQWEHYIQAKLMQATLLYMNGKLNDAQQLADSCLQYSVRKGYGRGTCDSYMLIGGLYFQMAKYDSARKNYLLCKVLSDSLQFPDINGKLYNSLGQLHYVNGEYTDALEHFKYSLKVFKKMKQSSKVLGLQNNIAAVYMVTGDTEKALAMYEEGLMYSREAGDFRREYVFAHNIAELYQGMHKPNMALGYFRQAAISLNALGDSVKLPKLFAAMGNVFMKISEFDSAGYYYKKGLLLSDKFALAEAKAYTQVWFSELCLYQGVYDSALFYIGEALNFYQQVDDKSRIAHSYEVFGNIFRRSGKYPAALEWYLKSVRLREEMDDKINISTSYLNLGSVHWDMQNHDKAIEYYQQSLSAAQLVGSKSHISNAYQHMAAVYLKQAEDSVALQYLLLSISSDSVYNNAVNTLKLNTVGDLYFKTNEISKALTYYGEYLQKSEEISDTYGKALALLNIGSCHVLKEQNLKAIKSLESSLQLSGDYSYVELSMRAHKMLSAAYQKIDNSKAFDHLNSFIVYKDSIHHLKKQEQVSELQIKYETFKKEKEIEKLKIENELKAKHIKLNKARFWLAVLAVGISLLGILFLIYRHRQRFKQSIKEKELAVAKSNIKGQEEERQRIAKELHDGVAASLLGIKRKMLTDQKFSNEWVNTMSDLYSETRRLSHNLLSPIWSESNLSEVLNQYILQYQSDNFEINFDCYPPDLNWKEVSVFFQNEIYRITQEVISNTLKHAQATVLDIQIIQNGDRLSVSFEDDGIGMDTETVQKGVGLRSMANRIKKLNGTIEIEGNPGEGTLINITVPLKSASVLEEVE